METSTTYGDLLKASDLPTFISAAIGSHKASEAYKTALDADEYDAQRNVTVNSYARLLYNMDVTDGGMALVSHAEDFTASKSRIASNFFANLVGQRVDYSLGAGVSFVQPGDDMRDETKERLGKGFDRAVHECAYCAVKHGVAYLFWNLDRVQYFKLTEFVPLYDETDGTLRAGIRFWRFGRTRPMRATLFREDGWSDWAEGDDGKLSPIGADGSPAGAEVVRAYKSTVAYTPADGLVEVVGEENYGSLPIVPMWASRSKQSALVGMRGAIDAYDLVKSGFANDVQDCATIYWIVRNAGGMTREDLAEFRDRLRIEHVAKVDGIDGADAVPHTQEAPYQSRVALLKELRDGLYEDFGALDVHTVAAGSTNDHIDAAYQPVDLKANDFEYWVGECIAQVLRLAGVEDSPVFSRQRISNQREQVEMVVQEAKWLDERTVLQLLPNITPDQVAAILERTDAEDMGRFGGAE